MSAWGVYQIQAKDRDGMAVAVGSGAAVLFSVRWRVNGQGHKRTFHQKGYAHTWRDLLLNARLNAWRADERGWPIAPATAGLPLSAARAAGAGSAGHTFASYVEEVWWPSYARNAADPKTVQGHRINLELAMQLLCYPDADLRDPRGRLAGTSLALADLRPDDVRAAIAGRRQVNGRIQAVNDRAARRSEQTGRRTTPRVETVSAATVRSFAISLGMVLRDAQASGHTTIDPGRDVLRWAPKPVPTSMTSRLVPSQEDVHALAEVIATLGPRRDGHPVGARFAALILLAGTTGPRPGECVAHRPQWLDLDSQEPVVHFGETESVIYLRPADRGADWHGPRRRRPLKARTEGAVRTVPLIPTVRDALLCHLERGYAHAGRTFTSPNGVSPLDWRNLLHLYWGPACERVFGTGPKAELAKMSPRMLRKAAITFWSEAGIPEVRVGRPRHRSRPPVLPGSHRADVRSGTQRPGHLE